MELELQGHGGEFSGYYCKFASVIDNRLLCVPYRSRDTEEVTMITGSPECIGDPADYCSIDPEKPAYYQQWLMIWMPQENAYRIINRHSGMLLCVQSRTDKENHRIVHYHDQALNFQWWQVQAFRLNEFKVVNKKSRKVLTAKNGSVVQQTPNESAQIQLWNIIPLEHSGYIGEYQIRNVNASKLLCVRNQSLSNDARVVIHENRIGAVHEEFCNFQWWRLFVRGWDKGGFVLQNAHSGKILCVYGRSMNNNVKAIQFQDQELPFQKWKLEPLSPDRNQMKIVNFNSSLVLSVQDSALHNDALVIQSDSNEAYLPFQVWELIKLSEEIDLQKLIKFFDSSLQCDSHDLFIEEFDVNLSPELLQWYSNFVKMFMMEMLAVVGIFPVPSQDNLTAVNHLILANSSIFTTLEALLETAVNFDTLVSIVKLIWEEDLWNQVFRLLFEQIWSLPTLTKATAIINSIRRGIGTARTVFLLQKAAIVLGILHSTKPKSENAMSVDVTPTS